MSQIRREQTFGEITLTSATSITVAASRVTVGGQQNRTTVDSVMDLTTTGSGGLDTGVLVLDTLYYVYAVNDSDSLGFVASTALPSVGPTGFTGWTEVGRFRTFAAGTDVAVVSYKGQDSTRNWEDFTPTSQGLGSPTYALEQKQSSDGIIIRGRVTTGTVADSEAQLGLPSGFTIGGPVSSSTVKVGDAVRSLSIASAILQTILATQGDTYLNFGLHHSGFTSNPTTPANGDALFSSAQKFTFTTTEIPIREFVGLFD